MYNGPYLRVLTPRTTNGNNVLLDESGMLQFREAHLPMSAKPHLDRQNRALPQHLRKKIEVVNGYQEPKKDDQAEVIQQLQAELAAAKAAKEAATQNDELAKLKAELAALKAATQTEPVKQKEPIAQPQVAKVAVKPEAKPSTPATPQVLANA